MKIAVMGSAGSSIGKAPFINERYRQWVEGKLPDIAVAHDYVPGEWDIWGCSPGCWGVIPRATRWFEVHRWENNVPWFMPEYRAFLRAFPGPVYTGGTVPEIKNHVVYPIDMIEEKFSSYNLTSSIALMLALAIDTIERVRAARQIHKANKVRQAAGLPTLAIDVPPDMTREYLQGELEKDDSDDIIGCWGVDMAAGEEYSYQRPGCQNLLLEAGRRGIGVYLPPESDLMRPMPVYGISEWDHNYIRLTQRAKELSAAAERAQAAIAEATPQLQSVLGQQRALESFVMTWTSPYGMQHGLVNRQAPGTGLGSGITHVDARPITRMTIGAPPPPPPPPHPVDVAAAPRAAPAKPTRKRRTKPKR